MATIYYKDGTRNEVPDSDLSYWLISQGWSTTNPLTATATAAVVSSPTTTTTTTKATLTSPDGKYKTVVTVGSTEASKLLSQGWKVGATGTQTLNTTQALNLSTSQPATTTTTSPATQLPAPGPVSPTTTTSNKYLYIDSNGRYIKVENGQQTYVGSMIGQGGVEELVKAGFVDYGKNPPPAVTQSAPAGTSGTTYTDNYAKYGVDPMEAYYNLRNLESQGIDWSKPVTDRDRPYGAMRLSPEEEYAKLQTLYRQIQSAVVDGVLRSGSVNKLSPEALKIIGTVPTIEDIRSGNINPILDLYKDAFIYGRYSKDDIINDLYERNVSRTNAGFFGTTLESNSNGTRTGQGIVHPTVKRDPWVATTFTPVDSAQQPFIDPNKPPATTQPPTTTQPPATPQTGTGDNGTGLIPQDDAYIPPPEPLITEFGGDETDELYDYILADLKANNERERDIVRVNYETGQKRASTDKGYDVEAVQDKYRAAGLYGSGIEQRGQERLAEKYDRGFQDNMRDYYLRNASVAEIDKLTNEDISRLQLDPSPEAKTALQDLRLKIERLRPKAPVSLQYQFTDKDRLRSARDMSYGAQRYSTLEKEQSLVEDKANYRWEVESSMAMNPQTGYIQPQYANEYNQYR